MAIIIDLKNAIRDKVNAIDNNINFNFNKIFTVDYPYIFFYIPSFRLDKPLNSEYWRKLTLMCVLEYAKTEENSEAELWSYTETLSNMADAVTLYDTKVSAMNPEFRTVDGVLQMTFDLEFYVRLEDSTELMRELEFTLR